MTITLEPGTEARLRERAAQEDQDADALANQMLTEALMDEAEREEVHHRALLESGLVKGEPVSGTIIRKREAPRSEEEKMAAFHQAMIAAGLLTRIPPPRDPSKAERPIFEVEGEPLSETIMRERR